MGTNGSGRSGNRVAANDNAAAEARFRAAVLTVARLLGRQIAREQSERQASANDKLRPERQEARRSNDMIRAAHYARYSSDLQSAASIKDQF